MKMLLILNKENRWHRIIRRAVVIGVLTALSVFLKSLTELVPLYLIPVATALLAAIDKYSRERKS